MAGRVEDYERTMAFADIALGQIKALRHAATPRNYEIWYAYASGYHPALNQQVNAIISKPRARSSPTLRPRADLWKASIADTADRAHRSGWQPSQRRDRSGHGDDRRRRRFGKRLLGEPRRRNRTDRAIKDRDQFCAPCLSTGDEERWKFQTGKRRKTERLKQEINDLQENLEAVRTESLTDPLTS